MATAPEDVINQALRVIGAHGIGDIYEGSPQSKAAVEVYRQTRDEVLYREDWGFALRQAEMFDAEITPPSPWLYEYVYPSDCVRIRGVRAGPLIGSAVREFDPQPVLYMPWDDLRTATPLSAVLTDVGGDNGAVLIYVGRVTNPALWDARFTALVVDELAKKLVFALTQSEPLVRARIGLAQMDEARPQTGDLTSPMRATVPQQTTGG